MGNDREIELLEKMLKSEKEHYADLKTFTVAFANMASSLMGANQPTETFPTEEELDYGMLGGEPNDNT